MRFQESNIFKLAVFRDIVMGIRCLSAWAKEHKLAAFNLVVGAALATTWAYDCYAPLSNFKSSILASALLGYWLYWLPQIVSAWGKPTVRHFAMNVFQNGDVISVMLWCKVACEVKSCGQKYASADSPNFFNFPSGEIEHLEGSDKGVFYPQEKRTIKYKLTRGTNISKFILNMELSGAKVDFEEVVADVKRVDVSGVSSGAEPSFHRER